MAKNSISLADRISIRYWDWVHVIRRSFQEFLAFPSLIIGSFLLLAVGVYLFERSQYQIYSPIHDFIRDRVFDSANATSDLLSNIAGSIITVTSITITLLLLIVQQTASNMTSQVFDQFLRRRSNQFFFGFFVGVAVYTLITLATVREPFNPVFAASLVFLFTIIALFMLLVLFYFTIHQMRPAVILQAIHEHTLSARDSQQYLIQRTRRKSEIEAPSTQKVRSNQNGFVTKIHLETLREVIEETPQVFEVVLTVSIGSYVAYQDCIAEIRGVETEALKGAIGRIRGAVQMERTRDLGSDPAFGIMQLEAIAWTVTSPSKSNLTPGLQAIYSMRDLLARWAEGDRELPEEEPLPVVYNDDVIGTLLNSFESIAVVATLSKEHQIITNILITFSSLFDRLPASWQADTLGAILRLLRTLDQHHLTANLERALLDLEETLKSCDQPEAASQVRLVYTRLKNKAEISP